MQVSIVIPSYNSATTLGATLEALEQQSTDCGYEIIVVDCSDDDSVARLVEHYPHARCRRCKSRFNPGEGRNLGATEALGHLLLFVDADVVLDRGAVQAAWRFYCEGHQLFGGALELNEQQATGPAAYLEHYFFNHESQKHRPVCDRANLSSALMMVDRRLFLKSGGFTDLPRMQDTEFTERLRSQGIALKFAPSVIGYQVQDAPLRKVLRKIFINGQNLYSIRYRRTMTPARKLMFLAALPLLTAFKVVRIIARHLRYQPLRQQGITILLVPLMFVSGIYWMLGFYKGILFNGGVSQQR